MLTLGPEGAGAPSATKGAEVIGVRTRAERLKLYGPEVEFAQALRQAIEVFLCKNLR